MTSELPALRALAAAADAAVASDGPDGLWSCSPRLGDFLRSGVGDLLHAELARLLEEPAHAPAGGGPALTVARSDRFSLSLRLFRTGERGGSEITSLPEHLVIGVVGPGSLALDVYREAPGYPGVFDRRRGLSGPTPRMLAPGDVACFRAGSDALVASVPTEATLALVLASSTVDRERRIYAADTLRAERVVSADPGASRLEFAARVLAELGGAGATPRLVRLTGHPAHFVRWTALQSLARVDGAAARDALRAALDDPHPHVRNAAGRALARSS